MASSDFRLAEWIIRPQRDCIERGNNVIHLKPKAMAVLDRLLQARGEVVTRDELFDSVWPGGIVSDATLTQCVVELRQAFGDSARNPQVIETVPKVGFRLIPPVVPLDHQAVDNPEVVSEAKAAGGDLASGSKNKWLGAAGIVLVISAMAWYLAATREPLPQLGDDAVKTLVVLPFDDLSEDQSLGWVADGLAEELTNQLANVDGLQVTGRTSASYYKYKNVQVGAIAEELGIEYVLEGSVRRDDNRLWVSTKLVDATNGFQVWTETFNRPVEDIVSVEQEIANAVAWAMGVTFDLKPMSGLTADVEAFFAANKGDAYLLSAWKEGSAESMLQGIEMIKQAVAIDPDFALAWGGLAVWYAWTGLLRDDRVNLDWLALSEQAAEQADLLRPDQPRASEAALNTYTHSRQWAKADQTMNQARAQGALDNAYSLYFWGLFLGQVGRAEEALTALQRSRTQDPQGPSATPFRDRFIGRMFLLQGRSGDALDAYERAWAEDMMVHRLGSFEGLMAALAAGDHKDILPWLQRAESHAFKQDRAWYQAMMERLDDPEAALTWLREAFDRRQGGITDPFTDPFIMNWAAYFGDTRLALQAMQRSPDPLWFWTSLMTEVRAQPEFKKIARELGLVDYWREYTWADLCRPLGADDFECD